MRGARVSLNVEDNPVEYLASKDLGGVTVAGG